MDQISKNAIVKGADNNKSVRPEFLDDPILPLTLYGPTLSYYTGKMEAVLRYMELPYERLSKGPIGEVLDATGVAQVPAIKRADGRWMTDSTPMIDWFDKRYPELAVTPENPLLAFFSRLLEDYADEWLWRPAMHYRWDYKESALHQSRVLSEEAHRDIPLPRFLVRSVVRGRQRKRFTIGDGVTAETWEHVEKIYLDTLKHFTEILQNRPFLLGSKPSLADFGFFGPMFRHFAQDPTSARIMRETAPDVLEWNARMWNARFSKTDGELLDYVPEDWGHFLNSIGNAYLPYLCANAQAYNQDQKTFNVTIEGAPYLNIRTSPYRVWCLLEIRRHFDELPEQHKDEARSMLEKHGCWEPLWRIQVTNSSDLVSGSPPYTSVGTMTGMTLKQSNRVFWLPVSPPKQKKSTKLRT